MPDFAQMLNVVQTADFLRSCERVLILTHVRPDGDTVGCAAALCAALRSIGKTAYLLPNPGLTRSTEPYFTPYALPENLSPDTFEPSESVTENFSPDTFEPSETSAPENISPVRIVSVDIATENLFPDNAAPYKGKVDLAMDHHPSFEHFARYNMVRPDAAACGELLYDVIARLCPITPEIALPLYVAISTDCGCFSYSNTTAYTHAVAAALMRTGIDFRAVNKLCFRTKTRIRIELESAMIRDAAYYDGGRVTVMAVPHTLIQETGATESDMEELSSLGGQIEGVDCAVTMRELTPGEWKISVRTGSRVNATRVCQQLGGGGHAAAAGCTANGSLEQVRKQILQAVAQDSDAVIDETSL